MILTLCLKDVTETIKGGREKRLIGHLNEKELLGEDN
jgi:hypothetical protein